MIGYYIFGFILATIANLYGGLFLNETIRKPSKLCLMPLLLLIYLDLIKNDSKLTVKEKDQNIINGLLFGFAGDAFILIENELYLGLGALSFFIGHIFYLYSIIRKIGTIENKIALDLILLFHVSIYVFQYCYYYLNHPKKLLIRSGFFYGLIVTLLVSFSVYNWYISQIYSNLLIMLGSYLFYISDSTLCYNVFLKKIWRSEFFIMLTYIPAQTLIILGMSLKI